ncbi:MAG TPA: methylated-DNA--[protein]-cysteine S-methyltransferase [Candidatus Tumulicola sp.]|jgi:AraC family transcriptional regulator of adaptative response/methylated-DNA-[protein]-cysteine methyltransferase
MLEHAPCSIPERIEDICRYIERHSEDPLTLGVLAAEAAMSRFHFARSFKRVVGVTAKQYVAETRMRNFQGALQRTRPVDAAAYDAGFGSISRVYEQVPTRLGMTPAQYRRAGDGVAISYATLETPAGLLMLAATDRGVCFVEFGGGVEELSSALRSQYANATIEPMRLPYSPEFRRWVDAIATHLGGERPHLDLPLDIRATAFQTRVWNYLRSIPYGSVASYGEVATGIGAPRAARAVASACANNPVALLVPCHRVIRGNGELGGYRWGTGRKRALLDLERRARAAKAPRA